MILNSDLEQPRRRMLTVIKISYFKPCLEYNLPVDNALLTYYRIEKAMLDWYWYITVSISIFAFLLLGELYPSLNSVELSYLQIILEIKFIVSLTD